MYIADVNKRAATGLVGAGRLMFGAAFLLAPSPTLRLWWPDDEASQPVASGLARGFGAREIGLGLGILGTTVRGGSPWGWLLAAIVADAADVVLTLTNSYSFGRRARLINLVSGALFIPLELYLAFNPDE